MDELSTLQQSLSDLLTTEYGKENLSTEDLIALLWIFGSIKTHKQLQLRITAFSHQFSFLKKLLPQAK